MNRQALGSRGERYRLYTRIEFSSAHFTISAVSNQPSPRQQPFHYTLQLAERLPNYGRLCDHNYIKALIQPVMQVGQNRSQAALTFVADNSFPQLSRCNDSVTITRLLVRANANQQASMPVYGTQTLNPSVISRPTQPQSGSHQLAGVPVCLLDMVRRYGKFVTATQATCLENAPSTARAHALAESMHTFTPANLWLPGTFG